MVFEGKETIKHQGGKKVFDITFQLETK